MLFALSEYDHAAWATFHAEIEALLPIVEPGLRVFRTRESETVPTSRTTIDADRAVEFEPTRVEQDLSVDVGRVVAGDHGAVREALRLAAAEIAQVRLASMRAALAAVTEAAGQVTPVRRKMNWDDVMNVIARVSISFDAAGNPEFVIWPPWAQAEYEALAPRTAQQEERWQLLMRTKREEARARQRDRRLH